MLNLPIYNWIKIKNVISPDQLFAGLHEVTEIPSNVVYVSPEIETNRDQDWILYPIDHGKHLLAHLNTGLVAYQYNSSENNKPLIQVQPYQNNKTENQWNIQEISNDTFSIQNEHSLKVLTTTSTESMIQPIEPIILEDNRNTSNQFWSFKSIKSIPIPPELTKETVEAAPEYTSYKDILPKTTPPKYIGRTLIPALMVTDYNLNDRERMFVSPYYVLEKYQYWTQTLNLALLPGERIIDRYTWGIKNTTKTDISKTLNMTITKEAGFKFGISSEEAGPSISSTYDIKKQITKDLKAKVSYSQEDMISEQQTIIKDNSTGSTPYFYAHYIKTTELVLKRISSQPYHPLITIKNWKFTDKNDTSETNYQQI